MTEYVTRWFAHTGEYTPFIDGVSSSIYRDIITGERLPSFDLPIGALFVLRNVEQWYAVGNDGFAVACVIPYSRDGTINRKHHWYIDGRASNCTMKDDNIHRCWCRHGTFGGTIHVDKNGNTCQAGAGSIAVPGFHGFLHNGVLRDC